MHSDAGRSEAIKICPKFSPLFVDCGMPPRGVYRLMRAIQTSRFVLRDLTESDRSRFLEYQSDLRYRRLYDLPDDLGRPNELFDLFVDWQKRKPRRNFQLGIFDSRSGRLCGCVGLRMDDQPQGIAILGIELTPDDWSRYGLAIEVAQALIAYGFDKLGLRMIVGEAASGNRRVEKLARWFGADIVARRQGPAWMQTRGWHEVDWALTRENWTGSPMRESSGKRASKRDEP